jgi:hypothetical protein
MSGARQALGHLFGIRPILVHQKKIEIAGTIFEPLGNDMHNEALALQFAVDGKQSRGKKRTAERLEDARPDNRIGNSGFVFQCHEDYVLGRARALSYEHKAADGNACTVFQLGQFCIGYDATRCQVFS